MSCCAIEAKALTESGQYSSCSFSLVLSRPFPLHLSYQKVTLSLHGLPHPLQLQFLLLIVMGVFTVAPLERLGMIAFDSGGLFHQFGFHPELLKHP